MKPRLPRHLWRPLLLCASLGALACGSLKSEPTPTPGAPGVPGGERPPAGAFAVTLAKEGPEFCREGTWALTVSVAGGTPDTVELVTNEEDVTVLSPPYRHEVDCTTHDEGHFSFAARAVVGGRSAVSPSVTVVVDRTPPTVLSYEPYLPSPSLDTPLEFTFTEPLLPASLQGNPNMLRDGNGFSVPHQTVLSKDGTVLRLVPASPLRPPVTLHVERAELNVTDLAGNPLSAGPSRDLKAVISYWPFVRVGERLSSKDPHVYSFALERSPEERPVVAFIEGNWAPVPTAELVVSRWNGEAWERLPTPREAHARARRPSEPQLQMTPQGGMVLAWFEPGDSTWSIHVMRYDGRSWARLGAPLDIGIASTDHYPEFEMAVDREGRPFLVHHEGKDYDLQVVRWTGTTWEPLGVPPRGNPEVQTFAWRPTIAVSSSDLVVAWSERVLDGGPTYVVVSRFSSGRWFRMGRVLRGTTEGIPAYLSLREQTVAWLEYDPDFSDGFIFVSRWNGGVAPDDWGPPELLQDLTPAGSLGPPSLVLDKDGAPWVAWTRGIHEGEVETVFRRHRATGWAPEQLIGGAHLRGFQVDDKGFPWAAVWSEGVTAVVRPR